MTAFVRPATLADALAARADHPDWTVLAGGTDVLVNVNHRTPPAGVIDLWRLRDLIGVDTRVLGANTWIRIGAGTTWRETIASETIARRIPIVAAAAREIGALQIQARGTVGGNLGTSSPVGDSLPVWLALDAEI